MPPTRAWSSSPSWTCKAMRGVYWVLAVVLLLVLGLCACAGNPNPREPAQSATQAARQESVTSGTGEAPAAAQAEQHVTEAPTEPTPAETEADVQQSIPQTGMSVPVPQAVKEGFWLNLGQNLSCGFMRDNLSSTTHRKRRSNLRQKAFRDGSKGLIAAPDQIETQLQRRRQRDKAEPAFRTDVDQML